MDNHPSCRRLHKIPAHTFKELRIGPQRLLRRLRRFRRSEPPIIAGFSASSTPRFEVRLRCFSLKPEGFPSKRAAYYGRLFVSVNTLFDELEVLREVVELTQAQKHLAYIKRRTPLRAQRGS